MKRLLIIDDDEDIRLIARHFLEMSGNYQVQEAATAAEGLAKLMQTTSDVLLLDYLLPDRTGLDVLQEIQSRKLLQNLKVILLTARQDTILDGQLLAAGAAGILRKPFDPVQLVTELETLLDD